MFQRWMARAVLAVSLVSLLLVPRSRPADAESTWAPIGPAWHGNVGDLGTSREWLRDGVLLTVVSGSYLARTRDHGETWQRVAVPTDGGAWGYALRTVDGPTGRIAFLTRSFAGRGTQQSWTTTLYRSIDDGDTWEKVWSGGSGGRLGLRPSPTLQRDCTLLIDFGLSVARSTDAGATWEDVGASWKTDVRGVWTRIGAVTLSPAYATDRTIVLHLDRYGPDASALPPDVTRGLLISTDAGSTWQALGVPTVDGAPHPSVKTIVFSPAYAEDGTLFVVATNEGTGVQSADVTRHLFRSTDRGQTWESVHGGLPSDAFVAVSPAFTQDQTILLGALVRAAGTETTGRCTIERSTDAGSTWSAPTVLASFDKNRYYNTSADICDPLVVQQGPDGIVAMSATNVSTDLGQTWQPLHTLAAAKLVRGTFSPGFAQDGTIFFSTVGVGIWAYGSRTQSAAGDLGCKVPLAEEIGNAYQKYPWVWATMGCPAEPPTREKFTFGRGISSSTEIWSSPENGVRLTQAQSGPSSTPGVDDFWSNNATAYMGMKFPQEPTRVGEGFIQRFETGQIWAIYGADGKVERVHYLQGVGGGHWEQDARPLAP